MTSALVRDGDDADLRGAHPGSPRVAVVTGRGRGPEADPVARAEEAGVTAAWTGPCDGAVQLARLAGPRSAELTDVDARQLGLQGGPPWSLEDAAVRAAVYQNVLTSGTQFGFYRWINLRDLAAVWHRMELPGSIASEWSTVLQAAGLLPA